MSTRSVKALSLRIVIVMFSLLVAALSGTLQAQTFQPVPGLAFTKAFGGAEPLPQVLTIAYTDQSAVRFSTAVSTSSGGSWLLVSPAGSGCCFTPLATTVSVAAGTLAAGTYTGQVVITNFSNATIKMTIPVTLTIAASGATFFDDLAGKLSFSAKTSGAATLQTVQVRNGGSGTLNWTLTKTTADGGNWLTVSSSSGTAPSNVAIGITTGNLPGGGAVAGTFVGQLLFATSGDSVSVPVAITIGPAVITQINPLFFTMAFGGANALPQILNVAAIDNSSMRYSVAVATGRGGNWLAISPAGSGCCFTPLANTVSVINAGTLAAGSYTGEIIITEFANPGRSMVVPVTLTIVGAGAFFADLPGQLSFSIKTNGTTATSQSVQINNGGSGTLNWTLASSTADGGNWLSGSPVSGTAPSTASVGIDVSQLPGGGAVAGTYIGQLVFQSSGDMTTIPVTVTVGAAAFTQLNPISFTMPFGGSNALPQILEVAAIDNSSLRYSMSVATANGGNWLAISPTGSGCCFTPLAHVVSVINASTLAAGSYTGEIIITEFANPGRSMVVPVNLTIVGTGAFFDTLPGQMSFSLKTGAVVATSQILQIRNGGSGTLNWTLTTSTADGGSWLTSSMPSGTAPSTFNIGIDVTQLPGGGALAGTFLGELTLVTSGDTSTIPVTVTVGAAAFAQANPISFAMKFGGTNPLPQIVTVAATDNSSIRFSATVATSNGGNWLSVSPSGSGCCFTPLAITASVNASALAAGTYTGEIVIIEFANPGRSMVVPVNLTVAGSGAVFDNLPSQMNFSLKAGGKVSSQTLQLGNGGSGKLPWTLKPSTADGGAWLSPSSLLGTATPKTITVKILPLNLPGAGKIAGTYVGQLLFQVTGGTEMATVPVIVTVGTGVFSQVNPVSFVMPFGGANPLPQVLSLAANDNSNIRFSASVATGKGGNWLGLSAAGSGCCFTPFPMSVSINASTLPVGVYTGEINLIQFANPGTSMTVPVVLYVVASSKAFFDNLPGEMSFSFTPSTTPPPSQTINIANAGAGTLSWSEAASTADANKWLVVTPLNGTAPGTYSVSVSNRLLPGKGLIAGTYVGQQLVKTKTGNVTIPTVVTVGDPVFIQAGPLTFNTTVGLNPAPQAVSVASSSTALRFTPVAATSKGGNWLSISPAGSGCCFTPTNLNVSVNASSLGAGTYVGEISIVEFANPGKSMMMQVILNVAP